jgi:hypothetical protein
MSFAVTTTGVAIYAHRLSSGAKHLGGFQHELGVGLMVVALPRLVLASLSSMAKVLPVLIVALSVVQLGFFIAFHVSAQGEALYWFMLVWDIGLTLMLVAVFTLGNPRGRQVT